MNKLVSLRTYLNAAARDTRGANLVEYLMLLGLIAIICIVFVQQFGSAVSLQLGKATTQVSNIVQ